MVNLYFIGSAGSGKSSLTGAFLGWMHGQGYDAVAVNLDPGIENAPYSPDVDIREWIKLKDIMKEYGVGPNGAQIIAADMLALNTGEIREILEDFETEYVIFDTPGQMELFTLRQSGKVLVDSFGADSSMIGFLFDPFISRTPSGFIALMLQSASVRVRFNIPFMGILTKSDLLKREGLQDILKWSREFVELWDAINNEMPDLRNQLNMEFLSALMSFDKGQELLPVSSIYGSGMEDIYNAVQQVFHGGEDLSMD